MSVINSSRFANKVRSMFGFKGDNPVPGIRDIIPVAIVEEQLPEFFYPAGDWLGCCFSSLGAVAAETFFNVIWNPPGSNVLGIIERVGSVAAGAVGVMFWTITDPAGNTGFARQSIAPRDIRINNANSLTFAGFALQFWSGTLTAAEVAAYPIASCRFPPSVMPWLAGEFWVVPPGFGFGFTSNTQNLLAQCEYGLRQHIQEAGIRS